jgi:uncharacterized membrane protein YidH (DUF202 family)
MILIWTGRGERRNRQRIFLPQLRKKSKNGWIGKTTLKHLEEYQSWSVLKKLHVCFLSADATVENCYLETLYSKTKEGHYVTTDSIDMDKRTQQSNVRTSLALIRTLDAEKRTHLAELRTGIGILTIPMSLLTILIATSNYYSIESVLSFIVGLVFGIIALALIGTYLVVQAFQKIRKTEALRDSCKEISCLIEELQDHE